MPTEQLPPVVIVDDDPDDLFFARRLLMRAQVKNPVVAVEGGEQAIAFLKGAMVAELVPCMVFLDIKMPRKDGFEVLEWARQQKLLQQTSFVMLSSSDQPKDRDRAALLGATAYLVKYPQPDEFRKTLNAHCRSGNGQLENA